MLRCVTTRKELILKVVLGSGYLVRFQELHIANGLDLSYLREVL